MYRQIVPFLLLFVLLIAAAIIIDYILHILSLSSIGFYFSFAGTILIILSFIYSLRKRGIIKSGSPKKLLLLHEYFSWIGALFILIHAGIHFNALLAWIAALSMIIAVASGLTGKYMLVKAQRILAEKKKINLAGEAEKKIFFESLTVDIMKNWRKIHIPITSVFFILAALHILVIIFLRSW